VRHNLRGFDTRQNREQVVKRQLHAPASKLQQWVALRPYRDLSRRAREAPATPRRPRRNLESPPAKREKSWALQRYRAIVQNSILDPEYNII
jgi:hypothetical protein